MCAESIHLPWGPNQSIGLDLPGGWSVRAVLEPDRPTSLPDFDRELDRAMKNPIGSPPLHEFARRGKTACVVVDDRTRPTPVSAILPRVMEELGQAGIKDEDISILIALGTHREMTEEEIEQRVGAAMARRFKVRNHSYHDPGMIVAVGRTPTHDIPTAFNRLVVEADTVVLVGCIEAHEAAGFGGGYKVLMPGVSGPASVKATHDPGFQKPPRISLSGMPREQCRFRQALDECGALLGPKVFMVNTVLDPVRTVAVVAGDPLPAHAQGVGIYSRMAEVSLDRPADVVIAGAAPLDLELRLSMKACFNAACALEPGGLFITVSRAMEGLGDLRLPKIPAVTRKILKAAPIKLIERLALALNPSPDQAIGTASLVKILKTAKAWLYLTPEIEGIDALRNMGIDFFSEPEALMARAAELYPRAEVVVMPQGGASFIGWDRP